MEIDAYSMCPCHSGSKIKFCCGKDVMHDLEEILSQTASGQTTAAIDHLDRTIAKSGPKECLLVIKCHLLLKSQRFEEANETNKILLGAKPQHFMGLQQRAMIEVANGKVVEAVNTLQDAMDQIKGEDIPINVGKTFVLIGRMLCLAGELLAGIPHLFFALRILEGEEAEEAKSLISSLFSRSVPIAKQQMVHAKCPEGVEWEKLYSNVSRAVVRGQFRKALQFLMKIDADYPEHEVIVGGLAVMETYLGRETAAQSWARYAELESLSLGQKIDATTIIALLDTSWDSGSDFGKLSFEIFDFDKVSEVLIASKHTSTPFDLEKQDLSGYDRRPRHSMALYNRPFESDQFDAAEPLSYWLGVLNLYGKQTDSPAQLELQVNIQDRARVEEIVKGMLGDSISAESEFETMGTESDERRLLVRRVLMPQGIDDAEARAAVKRDLRKRITEEWVKLPLGRDDLTIEEAIKRQEHLVFVHSRLSTATNEISEFSKEDYAEVAEEIGLQAVPTVDGNVWRALESPILLNFLEPSSLELVQLLVGVDQAMHLGLHAVTEELCREILQRDDRKVEGDFEIMAILAQATSDPKIAIENFEKAIELAGEGSYDRALCYLQIIRIKFDSYDFEGAKATLTDLQPYMDDSNIRYMLTSLLAEYGLLSPDTPVDSLIPKQPESNSELVVPGQTGESPTESKLWIPD